MTQKLLLSILTLFLLTGCAERGYTLKAVSATMPNLQSLSKETKTDVIQDQDSVVEQKPSTENLKNNDTPKNNSDMEVSPNTIMGTIILAIAIILL